MYTFSLPYIFYNGLFKGVHHEPGPGPPKGQTSPLAEIERKIEFYIKRSLPKKTGSVSSRNILRLRRTAFVFDVLCEITSLRQTRIS
jgi:hypothetical protein